MKTLKEIFFQELKLDNNKISTIKSEILDNYFDKSRKLSLLKNPWNCDCESYKLLTKVVSNNDAQKQMFTCFSTMEPLVGLDKSEICSNSVMTIVTIMISISSVVLGIAIVVFYKYNKVIKMFLYSRNWCLWWVVEDELGQDKKYDVFLSYCQDDEDFVMSKILPRLEKSEKSFKLCLQFRDWKINDWISDNITQSVLNSKRTVIVLSKNYLRNPWALTVFKTAHEHMIKEKCNSLIIIVYGEIRSTERLGSDIKKYLNKNTCISSNEANFWNKFLYALPHTTDKCL